MRHRWYSDTTRGACARDDDRGRSGLRQPARPQLLGVTRSAPPCTQRCHCSSKRTDVQRVEQVVLPDRLAAVAKDRLSTVRTADRIIVLQEEECETLVLCCRV